MPYLCYPSYIFCGLGNLLLCTFYLLVLFNIMLGEELSVDENSYEEALEICFPGTGIFKNYHPPLNSPEIDDMIVYDVSVGQKISKPIIAFLCRNGEYISERDPAYSTEKNRKYFSVRSISTGNENFISLNLILCQHSANGYSIYEMERFDSSTEFSRITCSSAANKVLLENIPIYGNMMIAQGLFHKILKGTSLSYRHKLKRSFEFLFLHNEILIRKVTNPVDVILEIVTLRWLISPTVVSANNPFSLSLEIVDSKQQRVENGRDSTLIVEVAVTYEHKLFSTEPMFQDFVNYTNIVLDGEETIQSYKNYDLILHKRAVKGLVMFEDVRILNAENNVFLNATLIVPGTGNRHPDEHEDFNPICKLYSEQNFTSWYTFNAEECGRSLSKAVVFSNPIDVHVQEAAELKLIDYAYASMPNPSVSANFHISNLWILVLDNVGERIFSGADAELEVSVHTHPPVCILDDHLTLVKGEGQFKGSVCEVVGKVELYFTAITKINGIKLQTKRSVPLNVTGMINLAYFAFLNRTEKSLSDPLELNLDPLSVTFAQMAVEDTTEGVHSLELQYLKNRRLALLPVNTEADVLVTTRKFCELMDKADDLSSSIKGVIGFGWPFNRLMRHMSGPMSYYQAPVVGLREQDSGFIMSASYPTVKLLTWRFDLEEISFYKFLKSRHWTTIVFLSVFKWEKRFHVSNLHGVNVIVIYLVDTVVWDWSLLPYQTRTAMKKIKRSGTKIIVIERIIMHLKCLIMNTAEQYGVAPVNGYHWIATDFYSNIENMYKLSSEGNKNIQNCLTAISGIMSFYTSFVSDYYINPAWFRLHQKWFALNRAFYYGKFEPQPIQMIGHIALGYDAVLVYAHAFNDLIKNNVTINFRTLNSALEKVHFTGLTHKVKFEPGGARVGFLASVHSFYTLVDKLKSVVESRWLVLAGAINIVQNNEIFDPTRTFSGRKRKREFKILDNETKIRLLEIPFKHSTYKHSAVRESKAVYRYYLSLPREEENVPNSNGETFILRSEIVGVSYVCDKGCGGNRTSISDPVRYEHGTCNFHSVCKCKVLEDIDPYVALSKRKFDAFTGKHCQYFVCAKCKNGECVAPNTCRCHKGWSGSSCTVPICRQHCVNGRCAAPNFCECDVGYQGDRCNILLVAAIVAGIITLVFLLALAIFGIRLFRKRMARQMLLKNLDWLVDWNDVNERFPPLGFDTPTDTESIYISPENVVSLAGLLSILAIKDETLLAASRSGGHTEVSTRYTNVVQWQGNICYAKKFYRNSFDVNMVSIRSEVVELKELHHPNLVQFIGACLTYPNVCLLVENVPKGSLNEILISEAYSLTWEFKYSILKDICKGMIHLHESKIGSHGRLKSSNCLIDNRWLCKITDFGAPSFRRQDLSHLHDEAISETPNEQTMRSLLWTSPEYLRCCTSLEDVGLGSKSADVYAFGIIMTEVCTHELPYTYEMRIISLNELFLLLKDFRDPSNKGIKKLLEMYNYSITKFIRPSIKHVDLKVSYAEKTGIQHLILVSTDETPVLRPTFKELLNSLNTINPVRDDLVENIIWMLERQTNHLGEVVGEKVKAVQDEKKKVENLLDRLLPPVIVEQIKLNEKMVAQKHENVSIFFSDIVGFTSLAKRFKPMQVVALLNELYTCFDSVVSNFNVYKVETIGDAYCVSSGIPIPNKNHAEELAAMSLYILSAVATFPVQLFLSKPIGVRIGMHSGSCVAGIVGIKMPRYSIFGIDVVMAEQMESLGAENRIHISESMAQLLSKSGNFFYKSTNEAINIKPIGPVKTYWLTGMYGFDRILPGQAKPPNTIFSEEAHTSTLSDLPNLSSDTLSDIFQHETSDDSD